MFLPNENSFSVLFKSIVPLVPLNSPEMGEIIQSTEEAKPLLPKAELTDTEEEKVIGAQINLIQRKRKITTSETMCKARKRHVPTETNRNAKRWNRIAIH